MRRRIFAVFLWVLVGLMAAVAHRSLTWSGQPSPLPWEQYAHP